MTPGARVERFHGMRRTATVLAVVLATLLVQWPANAAPVVATLHSRCALVPPPVHVRAERVRLIAWSDNESPAVTFWVSGAQPDAIHAAPSSLRNRATPTAGQGPDDLVDRSLIKVDKSEDAPLRTAITLSLSSIPEAGRYKGRLHLRFDKARCRLPIVVLIVARPSLELSGLQDGKIELSLADCSVFACYAWTHNLLDGVDSYSPSVGLSASLQITNTGSDATISVRARLRRSSRVVWLKGPAEETEVLPRHELIGATVGIVPAAVDLRPGSYVGFVRLHAQGIEASTTVSVIVNVKAGPFWAIVVLLVSFLLLAIARRSRRFTTHRSILRQVKDEERRANRMLMDRTAVGVIVGQLAGIRWQVEQDLDIPSAQAAVLAVRKRIDVLIEAQRLIGLVPDANKQQAQAIMADLLNAVRAEDPPEDLEALLQSMRALRPRGAHRPLATRVRTSLRRRGIGLMLYTVPVFLLFVATVVLAYLGLKELYLDNATFGSRPLFDYGGLAVWGLGTEIVADKVGSLLPNTPPSQ